MSDLDFDRIYELDKAIMYTDSPSAPGKRSKFVWSVRKNWPRITVFTNDPADKNNGMITAPLDSATLHGVLDIMDNVLRSTEEMKQKVDIFVSKWENNQRTGEKDHLATLWVGKNSQDINWISLISTDPSRPKIIFEYQVSDFYQFFKKDGTPYTKAEMSDVALAAAIRLLRNFFDVSPVANQINTPAKQAKSPVITESSTDSPTSTFEDINF